MTPDSQAARAAFAPDYWRHHLGNALTVITLRTQVLQRLTRRSTTLSAQERAQMLTTQAAVNDLARQVEGVLAAVAQSLPADDADEDGVSRA